MDHDDGPNFGYAYGGAGNNGSESPARPSWNPALRPDHDETSSAASESSEEITSNPAPAAKPVVVANPPPKAPVAAEDSSESEEEEEDEEEEEEEDEEEDEDEESDDDKAETVPERAAIAPAPQATAHPTKSPLEPEPTADINKLDQQPAALPNQPAPQQATNEPEESSEDESDEDSTTDGAQDVAKTEAARDLTNGDVSKSEPSQEVEPIHNNVSTLEEKPAHNYEHQGETTLLEDAVVESEKAPLVADSQPTTDDWGAADEEFDFGPKSQDPLLETPHAEAVGTTVGDDVIGNTKVGGNTGDGIDWGAGDDQDFFSNATAAKDAPAKSGPGSDAMWDLELDLDDEFLPDADEPAAPFDLDDDGFLDDAPPAAVEQPVQPAAPSRSVSSISNRYAPQSTPAPQPAASPYTVPGPQFTDLSKAQQPKPAVTPSYGAYGQASPYQQPARPAMTSSAQSFADKAKGGYASPYDLPEDVVTTRRRPAPRPLGSTTQSVPPPPRSSSLSSSTGVAPPRPPPASSMSTSSLSPPTSGHSNQAEMSGMPPPPKPASSRTPSNDFFAELPVTSKPKPTGRYTPQPHVPQQSPPLHPPPHILPKERTSSWSSLRNEILPDDNSHNAQLRQPDRLPVFPDHPSVPVSSNSLPVPQPVSAPPSTSRYSPAPPSSLPSTSRFSPAPPAPPAATSRYSPAPPQAVPHNRNVSDPLGLSRSPAQPYAPRTSSPLAYNPALDDQRSVSQPHDPHVHAPGHHTMHSADSVPRMPFRNPLEGVNETEEQRSAPPTGRPSTARSQTPPMRSSPSSTVGSPRKTSSYTPQFQPVSQPGVLSPVRSLTQSPETTTKQPHYRQISNEHPPSAYGIASPPAPYGVQSTPPTANIIPHKRQISHDFQYIAPTDERVSDPLERWKGYPIFHWGLGGTVITSFPKQIPRYGGGASMPMMKCSPGEVKIQSVKDILPLSEEISKFPGPLKAKSKKKEVSTWLGRGIESLTSKVEDPGIENSMNPADFKRLEEKALLWKVLQTLVDNDGHLEGNPTVEAAVRRIFSPEGAEDAPGNDGSFSTGADLVGLSRSNTLAQAEPLDPKAVEELRKLLTKGDREKAVWHAVDQRLWGHAMLLSSTLSKDVWKQVVQEFVRQEVKKTGRNNQALAALYEVFAGNWDDCIDELVPASARAGFQMISTDGAGSNQDALQGLDKWRETLSLILKNRSEGDNAALLSLGRLLAGYGRVEAAHICFIFGRSMAYLGGVDDQQSDIVLVGADHRAYPLDVGIDVEPILLTEIYEFALSLAATTGSHVIPHLQNYKLAHAYTLAEHGFMTDAQAYCDAIAIAMKSTTRISPYYNASFISTLDDLTKRLSQSPKDSSSSWISRPSMDKVSSSFMSKFNSFIAGDEDDAASVGVGGAEAGPFAKIAGSTPNLSPTQSNVDLYGAYSGYSATPPAPAAPSTATSSRYAPSSNAYAPRSSSEQVRPTYEPQGRSSFDSQPSNAYMPSPSLGAPYTPSQAQFSPRSDTSKTNSYAPLKSPLAPTQGSSYQPTPPLEDRSISYGSSYEPPRASFEASQPSVPEETTQSSGGYEPPTTSYEPPSYQPYEPDEETKPEEEEEEKPKKKSFMDDDDDDDLAKRAASLKISSKSDADRKADEAFRKAAEADAQRDKEAAAKKAGGGWFGGWFKKDPNAGPGPIKAKLGEENSFYYDPELKKWVNKKGGAAEASKPMATPPPPRSGPPSRNVSGNTVAAQHALGGSTPSSLPPTSMMAGGPPTSNPQRSSSMPPPMLPLGGPPSRSSTPGLMSDSEGGGNKAPPLVNPGLLASGPPSRPSTGLSNASSIDDLLGAATANKGPKKGKKRGGRYVDVMAQK
ncbi:hypothetical protein BU24DRAFT_209313 [Aaosphaeria arxii CBS 175.79]|uniref:Protein transport protein sec16 n=1 Tax=Aaosphaeria arxii CBS 175.79 TaxID=1450172 RepID=A0A6A5XVK3_9PLEO|nr:uncharacterized protein BU24DRAFT_209313 [Aaosphaeria arxii CBS 175.79]KAF2016741.1 hypothetical protein BU24DRAFT_209313 [Aaosphaeria arxii CBS 175.79]